MGKRVINNMIGDESEEIVNTLTKIVEQVKSPKEAKASKEFLYKLATKLNVMVEEKRLTEENTAHAEIPFKNFGVQILKALEDSINMKEGKKSRQSAKSGSRPSVRGSLGGCTNVRTLRGNVERIRHIVENLLKPHLQPKNFEKMTSMIEIYGCTDVLNGVLNDPKFESERKVLLKNLEIVIPEQVEALKKLRERSKPVACKAVGCTKHAVPSQGQFKSSGLCEYHHYMVFKDKIENPVLEQFLADKIRRTYFYQYLTSAEKEIQKAYSSTFGDARAVNLFLFVRGAAAYLETDRKLKRKKAEAVIQKYLNPKASATFIGLDTKIIDGVKKTMEDSDNTADTTPVAARRGMTFNAPPKELFDEAVNACQTKLKLVFTKGYLKSGIHRLYLATIQLPPFHAQRALEEIKAHEKATVEKE